MKPRDFVAMIVQLRQGMKEPLSPDGSALIYGDDGSVTLIEPPSDLYGERTPEDQSLIDRVAEQLGDKEAETLAPFILGEARACGLSRK